MEDELGGMVESSLEEIEEMQRTLEEQEGKNGELPENLHWERLVPLGTAVLAVLGTIAALLAAFSADRQMDAQLQEVMNRSAYRHFSTQLEILRTREAVLIGQGKDLTPADREALTIMHHRERAFDKQYDDLERQAVDSRHTHHILAGGITVFQISIALSATALISRRRWVWFAGLGIMTIGLAFSVWGAYDFFFF